MIAENRAYQKKSKSIRANFILHSYDCVRNYKGECDYAIIISDNLDSLDIKMTIDQLEHKFKGLEIYVLRRIKQLHPMVA